MNFEYRFSLWSVTNNEYRGGGTLASLSLEDAVIEAKRNSTGAGSVTILIESRPKPDDWQVVGYY